MKKLQYKIYTLGCKVNQYDSGALRSNLEGLGFSFVPKNADLVILNTCAVTKTAIHKAKRLINKLKSENKGAKFILMGCWPKIYRDDIYEDNFDFISGVGKLEEIILKVREMFNLENIQQIHNGIISTTNRSRYSMKIQEGCEQFCSYCIIPYTRGHLKSRAADDVLREFQAVLNRGYNEIVLCGIHLGLYGKDWGIEDGLVHIVGKMLDNIGGARIRLSSIEINEVSDELIDLIANSNGKICRHLHIPLQAGDDKILKAMNRPYNTIYFRERIEKIKKVMPDIAITTDIIVGFPGEDDENFDNTYQFAQEMKFSKIHVFPFSAHEKTPAYQMKYKVESDTIKQRSQRLRDLSSDLKSQFRDSFRGRKLKVLIEKVDKGEFYGKSEFYFDVVIKNVGDVCVGRLVDVLFE